MVGRAQAVAAGLSRSAIEHRLICGRWRKLHRSVYVTHTGGISRQGLLWAAVLACGDGATISHRTAAELHGLYDEPEQTIHVTLPVSRRIEAPAGVQVHYAERLSQTRHPVASPPRTRVDETVLDLVDTAGTAAEAVDVVTRACQRRRTTASRLRVASEQRKQLRHRRLLERLLADVAQGAQSPLELAYLRQVERPHGLPPSKRQRAGRTRSSTWRDVVYLDLGVIVELDGSAAHPDDQRSEDQWRDNEAQAVRDGATLRYGWRHVAGHACGTAGQVGRVLRNHGWSGRPRPCGPSCALSRGS